MTKRLLCVWLPNWPVQRIQAEEPQLADAPLILSARDARRGIVVAAANLAARAEGVRADMRLSEASALVDAEIREHEVDEDIEVLCSLAEQAQQFTPIVGIEQLDKKIWSGRTLRQPECLMLDITGLPDLFGGEIAMLEKVSHWLHQQGYFGCMGIAASVGGAWAAANYATRTNYVEVENTRSPNQRQSADLSESNQDEKVAAEKVDHSDQTITDQPRVEAEENLPPVPACRYHVVAPGSDRASIGELPLAALRIAPDTIASLRRLGLRRIADLSTLPRDGLATRLGDQLIQRWDQAFGLAEEPVVALHSSPDWCLEQSLEYPTQNRATIAELVRRLSGELSRRLSKRGEGAIRIVCRLDLVKSQPVVMQLSLFRPTNDAAHLEVLLSGQLEQQLRFLRSAPLWRLSLQATLTAAMVWRQADLFDGGESASRNQLARLVDTLSNRLGRKQVLGAKLRRESQPELAYSLQPLTGRRADGGEQDTVKKLSTRFARNRAAPSRDDPLRRPSHLFENPVSISVAFQPAEGTSSDGANGTPPPRLACAPDSFVYQTQVLEVIEACGPERLESGWWRGPSVRRDYYRVETRNGSWWWLFRDLNNGQWFVHGVFD